MTIHLCLPPADGCPVLLDCEEGRVISRLLFLGFAEIIEGGAFAEEAAWLVRPAPLAEIEWHLSRGRIIHHA